MNKWRGVAIMVCAFSSTAHGADAATVPAAQDAAADGEKPFIIVPKYFEPTKGSDNGGLGFSYKINYTFPYDVIAPVTHGANAYSTFRPTFKAEGNVAFNRDINPADFLKTALELNYVYQSSTAVTIGGAGSKCDPKNPDTVKYCEEEARSSKTGDNLTVLAGFVGSLESDQRFDKKNTTYGGHLTTAYRPAPGSLLNQANPLDWPFRLLRTLTSHPLGSYASPDAFPKVRLAAERVEPSNDTDRAAILGNTHDYDRVNIELAMTSPVAMLQGKQIKFEWSWRYFKEIDADSRIKAAGIDRFRYSAATLRHDTGWQLTYASGKLPLDRQKESVWELGYRINLP